MSRAFDAPKIPGKTSRAGRARRKSATVHSGLSRSTEVFFRLDLPGIPPHLSLVRLAQADDVKARASRRVHKDMQSSFDGPEGSEPAFAIVASRVFEMDRQAPIEIDHAIERDAVHVDVARIFRRIEREVHRFIVYATNREGEAANQPRSRQFSRSPGRVLKLRSRAEPARADVALSETHHCQKVRPSRSRSDRSPRCS